MLWAAGEALVNSEPPQKADMIVVLAGDYLGNRILKGAQLARDGYAAKVLVSNGGKLYGTYESLLAIDFAVRHGYPREMFIPVDYPAVSTVDEARRMIPHLRTLGVHKFLLVTSPSHTARAFRIFRRAAPDLEAHPVAAPDPRWCGGEWWRDRECEKTFALEEAKTVTSWFGI
ncbi:MAG TPA: YdcF family protein [Bryobacteraceae bacterium]|nr:YdcF family protein [Bryobacteraceae bacterium]